MGEVDADVGVLREDIIACASDKDKYCDSERNERIFNFF
jgi:hypothetical protein